MGGMQAGPQAFQGQQGGQPYYNLSMMQGDDPSQLLQRAGSQLGAGQVSGGIGPPNEQYPQFGGGGGLGWAPWEPQGYDPNLLTKPGGGREMPSVNPTDPVTDPTTVVNKPKFVPDIPDFGPPPDIPGNVIALGEMTPPGGNGGGGGGGGGAVHNKLGLMGTALANRKRDLGGGAGGPPNSKPDLGGGAGGPPNPKPNLGGGGRPPYATSNPSLHPDIQKTSYNLNDPNNRTVINPHNPVTWK
jgi:hypothetical protein